MFCCVVENRVLRPKQIIMGTSGTVLDWIMIDQQGQQDQTIRIQKLAEIINLLPHEIYYFTFSLSISLSLTHPPGSCQFPVRKSANSTPSERATRCLPPIVALRSWTNCLKETGTSEPTSRTCCNDGTSSRSWRGHWKPAKAV